MLNKRIVSLEIRKGDEIMTSWQEEIKKVNECPQRQDSTTEQMIDLYSVANKLGFYDAADFIKLTFIEKSMKG